MAKTVPIISPKTPSDLASEFKVAKMKLREKGYPNRATAALTVKYFNLIKERLKGIDKDTVIAMVPSGSLRNKITPTLAVLLTGHFGCTCLPFNSIVKTNPGEAKNNLSLEKRNLNPITYKIDAETIKRIASSRPVVVFDDVIGSGESSIRLKQTLERAGIQVTGIMALVTVEKAYPSLNDKQRVLNKLVKAAGLNEKEALKLSNDIDLAFSPFTRQKLNRVERIITDKSAVKIISDIAQAAAIELDYAQKIGNFLTLDEKWHSPTISPSIKESKARGM
jgi:hypothetical protein